jgi:hypothetical protein
LGRKLDSEDDIRNTLIRGDDKSRRASGKRRKGLLETSILNSRNHLLLKCLRPIIVNIFLLTEAHTSLKVSG